MNRKSAIALCTVGLLAIAGVAVLWFQPFEWTERFTGVDRREYEVVTRRYFAFVPYGEWGFERDGPWIAPGRPYWSENESWKVGFIVIVDDRQGRPARVP
jgi:hypothetical protein